MNGFGGKSACSEEDVCRGTQGNPHLKAKWLSWPPWWFMYLLWVPRETLVFAACFLCDGNNTLPKWRYIGAAWAHLQNIRDEQPVLSGFSSRSASRKHYTEYAAIEGAVWLIVPQHMSHIAFLCLITACFPKRAIIPLCRLCGFRSKSVRSIDS